MTPIVAGPAGLSRIALKNCCHESIGVPLKLVMTSPDFKPAVAAGLATEPGAQPRVTLPALTAGVQAVTSETDKVVAGVPNPTSTMVKNEGQDQVHHWAAHHDDQLLRDAEPIEGPLLVLGCEDFFLGLVALRLRSSRSADRSMMPEPCRQGLAGNIPIMRMYPPMESP